MARKITKISVVSFTSIAEFTIGEDGVKSIEFDTDGGVTVYNKDDSFSFTNNFQFMVFWSE